MATHETNWILRLVDQITSPLKKVSEAAQKTANSTTEATQEAQYIVEKLTGSFKKMGPETQKYFLQLLGNLADAKEGVLQQEAALEELEKQLKEVADAGDKVGREQIQFQVNEAKTKIDEYKAKVIEVEEELEKVEAGPDGEKMKANWGAAVVIANQTAELVGKALDLLKFTGDIEDLRDNVRRLTGTTGDELDKITAKAFRLGEVFKESPEEIAKAANAMTKQVGGSYEENLKLIEDGFKKGANLNGDFIDQLKEYPTFVKQLGLTQSEAITLMAKAGEKGIFSDKAIDSLKEADLSLREMGKAQVEALKGIGIEASDLAGKTSFEAVQMITKSMEGATTQAKQLVLTDIFKGAGEDAGMAWIEGLGSIDLDITKIPSVESASGSITGWLADLKTSFSATFGDIGTSALAMAPVVTAVASMIPLISTLTKVTWLQDIATKAATAGQWLLNIAMDANPIGLIILAVAALIALVALIIVKYDEWGAALTLILGPFGMLINVIQSFRRHWDSIVDAFKNDGIVAGLKRIGIVLLDALLMPMQQLLEILAKIPGLGGLASKGADFIQGMRDRLELITPEEKKREEEKKTKGPTATDIIDPKKPLLDGTPPVEKKKTKGLKENESTLNGSGGNVITMTLEVNNYFNVKDGNDIMSKSEQIIDMVVGGINSRVKDGLIAATA